MDWGHWKDPPRDCTCSSSISCLEAWLSLDRVLNWWWESRVWVVSHQWLECGLEHITSLLSTWFPDLWGDDFCGSSHSEDL